MTQTQSAATVPGYVVHFPRRLMTVADFLALGEDDGYRTELSEGNLVVTPSGVPKHSRAASMLWKQLDTQVPRNLLALQDVDVDLELVAADRPGTVRRPDVFVVSRLVYDRVGREGGVLRAGEVALAVEIVSPGSQRTDRLVKRAEYADAGIPHYWIVELGPPTTATICTLVDGAYVDDGPATGIVTTDAPFSLRVDLDVLT